MPLYLELKPGDRVHIGTSVVTVESKSGGRTRVMVESDYRVKLEKAAGDTLQRPTNESPADAAVPFKRPRGD